MLAKTSKILSTRLLEALVMSAIMFGGYVLILKSDMDHLKNGQQEHKGDAKLWYNELKHIDKELDYDVQTMKAEFYKHNHK